MKKTLLKGMLLSLCWAAEIVAEVEYDAAIPQLVFSAEKVKAALGNSEASIRFEIQPDTTKPEAFSIERTDSDALRIIGSDVAGAMYGGLEVAELIRIGGVKNIKADSQTPYMEMRGVKFNIPLDVRTPSYSDMGDAGQHNIEHVWDFSFWQEFIDEVAGHRYNYISLWNLHPFPSLVKVPDYPDVALDDVKRAVDFEKVRYDGRGRGYVTPELLSKTETLKTMSIDDKIAFWRKVMRYGKSRNVDFYFVTWNVFDYGTFGKYGINDQVDNPVTIDYFRKSVKQLFLTYPDLKGIGVTTGENMNESGAQEKEDWMLETYGKGVLDAVKELPGRKITFLHRQHEAGALAIADTFKPLIDHPNVDFIFSFKYAKAHAYSSVKQYHHHSFAKQIKGREELKTIWTMRNDSCYLFRWASPDFMREYVQNIPMEMTRGYYFGSDGWVFGREFIRKDMEGPRPIELKKHWFQWLLWGRLAYNPTLDNQRFTSILQSRFPSVNARQLMEAWQAASMVYPLTTGFHWGALDYQWYIEGCVSMPAPARTKTGFHDVNRFITLRTHNGTGYVSIPNYVKRVASGTPFKGTGPMEIAQQLHANAARALGILKTLEAGDDRELSETLQDIETVSWLGHYYGYKIKGAALLHLYRANGEKQIQQESVAELEKAAVSWRKYSTLLMQRYPQTMWMNRIGTVDFKKITEWVDQDVEIAKQ